MEEITQPRGAVGAATIAEAFRITAAERADEVAVRTKGDEIAWTWGELRERVDALAAGLAGLGLERGDTVALLFGNRPEFHLCDLAVVTAGATPFSIYMQYGARADPLRGHRRRRARDHHRAAVPRQRARGAQGAAATSST